MELRNFQSADVAKLQDRSFALIGHEQGLGKTVITSVAKVRPGTIIVCPSSLRLNWEREINVWRPDIKDIQIIRKRTDELSDTAEVVIVSYDLLSHIDLPAPFVLILDESQAVKNRKAKRSQKCAELAQYADEVFLLSGTPFPNRPRELWTQLRLLRATELSYYDFAREYCAGHKTRWGFDDSGISNIEGLRELVNSVMIRREKKDVLKELPAKTHQIIEIEGNVSAAEQALAERAADAIRQHGKLDTDTVSFEELSEYRRLTGERKIADVIKHVRDLLEGGQKVVLFAHHKDIIAEYARELEDFSPVVVTGDTQLEARQAAVDSFQGDDKTRLFIGNIIAAGTGITLTAASLVVFGEIDWVPGNMAQAADRVHRIGQEDAVLIQYIVTRSGLDHRLLEALLEKEENISAVIQPTEEDVV
jgi:SWI/SNF-related matrix-associated actin-dependent regulator 1 of chromatin subfamily A